MTEFGLQLCHFGIGFQCHRILGNNLFNGYIDVLDQFWFFSKDVIDVYKILYVMYVKDSTIFPIRPLFILEFDTANILSDTKNVH